MRSTLATAAVERLKSRSGNPSFSVVMMSGGLFYLVERTPGAGAPVKLSDPLPLDTFVTFVNAFGPPKPERKSKINDAFAEQVRQSGK
jgi:hypothetical protein